ncbi:MULTISPECIES: AI-2E family transporter [Micromonospora]|uniref:AI-2E family transporter n=1 Tax=Micromonospora solifontis TaxID=2487138 RepID=A0ABX9WBJ6_9ACTN|nr:MULTISPECIES: AI-2E family transporter [Micromonospora]NES12806.1 AI-2E family transporter [Micromonospora sp. PPF5-17B]NES38912.1 AI-2E family transporter [Micromonospora solifontis]NES54731.1 AI-2E family transporter [Micromonospora sp. PPF5-6]RNL92574.1 AI-2E family transporter [Micromonospora solifontis]
MPEHRTPNSGAASAWEALPWSLRVATVCGLCVLVLATTAYLVGRLLLTVAPLCLAVAVSLLLTALLSPVSRLLRRLRVPNTLAALGAVLTLLGLVALAVTVVTSQVATEFDDLGATLSAGLAEIRQAVVDGPLPIDEAQLDAIVAVVRERVTQRSAELDPAEAASVTLEAVGAALLAVILLFFLLKDGSRMWAWLLRPVPQRLRTTLDEAGRAGWWALSRYIGGQVVVAAVDAIGIGVALLIIGVPLALPLALLTFLGGFVPIVGATVAGVAAALVALVANGPTDALLVIAAVIVVQQLEGNLLEPLIVGRALRLHPVPVLLAVTAGTLLGGIAGAVVAVPILAVLHRTGAVLVKRGTRQQSTGTE